MADPSQLFHRHRQGDTEIVVLSDGMRTYPIESSFIRNATVDQINAARVAAGRPAGVMEVEFNAVAIRRGSGWVLVDTGNGPGRFATTGRLPEAMSAAGISADRVEAVLISHFHPDHINGLVTPGGDFTFPAAADTVRKGNMAIVAPWARASIGTSRPAAAYLTILNEGSKPDVLVSATTSVSGMAEVHQMTMTDGIARMEPAGAVDIPAGREVALKPGGLHVMLMKLKQPLKEGEKFTLILIFENAGPVGVSVPVLGIGASGPAK